MCAPSTSASAMRITRSYRRRSKLNSLSMPVPSAVMSARISSWLSILSTRAFSTLRILPWIGRIAWNCRSRPALALPPADSPSTTKISHLVGSFSAQSASLPGSVLTSSAFFRRTSSRAWRAASRARAAWTALATILRASRVRLAVLGQLLADNRLDEPLDLRVAELRFGLAFELGLGQLDREDGREALADVLSLQAHVPVLEQALTARVVVDRAREGRAEPHQVRSALD